MSVSFVSPEAALVAIGVAIPLAAFVLAEARARRARVAIGLAPPPLRTLVVVPLSICAVAGLAAVAVAQPVVTSERTRFVRSGTEAFFVVDISRSMLAAERPGAARRFDRAISAALTLRRAIPDVPVGVASLSNRLLPHLFPTTGPDVFAATLERALDVERPPPDRGRARTVTTFAPLAALREQNYFTPRTPHRLAVVFTDGETSDPLPPGLSDALETPPAVRVVFVHVSRRGERVFGHEGLAEPAYRPDPASGRTLARLAARVGGRAFSEDDLGRAADELRRLAGAGPRVAAGRERRSFALAPYALLAAFAPLAVVLRHRNF